MKQVNWEVTARRLIGLGLIGGRIDFGDGHRWLVFDQTYNGDGTLYDDCRAAGVAPPYTKIYGGIEEALDRVDATLKALGKSDLLGQCDLAAMIGYFDSPAGLVTGEYPQDGDA